MAKADAWLEWDTPCWIGTLTEAKSNDTRKQKKSDNNQFTLQMMRTEQYELTFNAANLKVKSSAIYIEYWLTTAATSRSKSSRK